MNFNETYKQSGNPDNVETANDFFNYFGQWEIWIGTVLAIAILVGIYYLVPVVQKQSGHDDTPTIQTVFKNVPMSNFGSDEWMKENRR